MTESSRYSTCTDWFGLAKGQIGRAPSSYKFMMLAGVGFALAMNWGQTGRSCHYFSFRTCFGPPLFGMINHVEL